MGYIVIEIYDNWEMDHQSIGIYIYNVISWEYNGTILGYIITNLICCFGFQMASLASWSFNQRLNFGCEWNSFSQTVGGTFMGIQWDKNGIYPHWSQNIWWRAAGKFRNWRCFFAGKWSQLLRILPMFQFSGGRKGWNTKQQSQFVHILGFAIQSRLLSRNF